MPAEALDGPRRRQGRNRDPGCRLVAFGGRCGLEKTRVDREVLPVGSGKGRSRRLMFVEHRLCPLRC